MIIRKKTVPNKKSSSSTTQPTKKGSVIKKEDLILDVEKTKNTNEAKEEHLAQNRITHSRSPCTGAGRRLGRHSGG